MSEEDKPEELNELDSMCMTWRHDFGLLTENQRDDIRNMLRQLCQHHVLPKIAEIAALKKDLEEKRWEALKWQQQYDSVMDEHARVGLEITPIIQERDCLKRELEVSREESFERGQRLESLQIEYDQIKSQGTEP